MTDPNINRGPRMRGQSDLFREQMDSDKRGGDRQFESFRQEKQRLTNLLNDVEQRKENLSAKLQKRILEIKNPETAQQFQMILDQLQQQFALGKQEVVQQANAGIDSIQRENVGFRLPAQEVFNTAIAAEQQAILHLNGIVGAFRQRASAKQGELRQKNAGIRQETDQMIANYEADLSATHGGKSIREADQEVKDAKVALKRANVEAAAKGLPKLKVKKSKLAKKLVPKEAELKTKKAALEAAKTKVKTETEAKTKAEALPAEIQNLEAARKTAQDAVDAAQKIIDDKRLDAVANRVKADYLTKPKAIDAVTACNTDADTAKVGKPPAQVAQIETKCVNDVKIIREFFSAQDALTVERKKVTDAQTSLNTAKATLTAEEAALRIPAAAALPLQKRVDAIVMERQKRVTNAEAAVQAKEKEVTTLEQEIENDFTTPMQDLDGQIKLLEDPINEAMEVIKIAQEKARNLGKVVEKPDANEQAKFLEDSRALLKQINKEGKYMREHFSGEQPTESRTIELVKRRTEVATEIADHSDAEKDIRAALDYAREELRWLKRNADQHETRIAELRTLVQRNGEKYCEKLQKKTEASIGKPLAERWQPIQQEIMALEEYQPETGKERIDVLKQRANDLVKDQHEPLMIATNSAIIACENHSVQEWTIRDALSVLTKEGVFLKKYGDRGNRLVYLYEQHAGLSQKLAATRGEQLRGEATRMTNAGTVDGKRSIDTLRNLIETEQDQGEGVDARARQEVEALKNEQLPKLAQETDRVLLSALANPDRAAKMQALSVLLEEAQLLHTHFLPTSNERKMQLSTRARQLLDQIAEQTDSAILRSSDSYHIPEEEFRRAYPLLAQEQKFLTRNRALQYLQPDRIQKLATAEWKLDVSLSQVTKHAVENAKETKRVVDIDRALSYLRFSEQRNASVVNGFKHIDTADLQIARRDLETLRKLSAESEGLKQAERTVDIQKKIGEVKGHLSKVEPEPAESMDEPSPEGRVQRLAELKNDKTMLQQNLSRASATERRTMESLIKRIDEAMWSNLRLPEENKTVFKKNFSLMVEETKAKIAEMREPVLEPTLKKLSERMKTGQAVYDKAQGYINVATGYGIDADQLKVLQDHVIDLKDEITRTQKVVATYKNRGKQRS